MTNGLDEAFRSTTRLRVAAFLSGCDEAEFRAVQNYCDLQAYALSKNVAALEDLAYVVVRKGHVGKTPRTWLSLSAKGRKALEAHVTALQEIAQTAARHSGAG